MADVKPIKHNWRFIDLTGQRFGKLIAVENVPAQYKNATTGRGATMWRCECDCGGASIVSSSNLMNRQISCGCARDKASAAKGTHRMTKTPEYNAWIHAKARCFNPKNNSFARYGGRGIKMCKEWASSFESFYAYIGPRPNGTTLDRYPNNDGNYEPGNVRWATIAQQNSNRRKRTKYPKRVGQYWAKAMPDSSGDQPV
jgi:hypothetical protein